jgi:hypothetical protein
VAPGDVPEDKELLAKEVARVLRDDPDIKNPEEHTDPSDTWREREFAKAEDAKKFAEEVGMGEVYERINITEDPEAPGMWDWEERRVS